MSLSYLHKEQMKMGFITRSSGITSLNVMTGRNSPMPSRPYILRSGYPCNRLTCSVYMFHFLVFTVLPYITDCISQFSEFTITALCHTPITSAVKLDSCIQSIYAMADIWKVCKETISFVNKLPNKAHVDLFTCYLVPISGQQTPLTQFKTGTLCLVLSS